MARQMFLSRANDSGDPGSSAASSRDPRSSPPGPRAGPATYSAPPMVYAAPPRRSAPTSGGGGGDPFETAAMKLRKEFCQFFLYRADDQLEVLVKSDNEVLHGRYIVDGDFNDRNRYSQVNADQGPVEEDPLIYFDGIDGNWKLNDKNRTDDWQYVAPLSTSKSFTDGFDGMVPPTGKWRNRRSPEQCLHVTVQTPQPEIKNKVICDWMSEVENLKAGFQHYDPMEVEESKRDALRKLHVYWAFVLPSMIPEIIDCLGANSARFMKCLSTKIPNSLVVNYPMFSRFAMRRLQFAGTPMRSHVGEWNDITDDSAAGSGSLFRRQSGNLQSDEEEKDDQMENEEEEAIWEYLAPKNPQAGFSLSPAQKVEIQFQWCGIEGLLTNGLLDFRIVGALSAQSDDSGVFGPVASQAILQECWESCGFFFALDLLSTSMSVFCLFMTACRHKEELMYGCQGDTFNPVPGVGPVCQIPAPGFWIAIIAVINYEALLLHSVTELIMAFDVFSEFRVCKDPRTWFGPYLTSYNSLMFVVEVGVCYMVSNMLESYLPFLGGHAHGTYIDEHPISFVILIAIKWGQLLLTMLASDFFGMTVLPAVYAMKSAESVRFLIYICLILLMATHAYFSLPLDPGDYETYPTTSNIFFVSFVRMFRLCVLGDFDLFELEGVDAGINMTELGADGFAAVDEPSSAYLEGPKAKFHSSLRMIFMITALVTTVVIMNMYIGILSMAYENFHSRKVEMFSHQKARFTMRFLLRRRMALKVTTCFCGANCAKRFFAIRDPSDKPQRLSGNQTDSEEEEMLTENGQETDVDDATRYRKIVDKQRAIIDDLNYIKPHNHDGCALSMCKGFWTTLPANLVRRESQEDIVDDMAERQVRMSEKIDQLLARVAT